MMKDASKENGSVVTNEQRDDSTATQSQLGQGKREHGFLFVLQISHNQLLDTVYFTFFIFEKSSVN
jgi:hypothetical protein